MPKLYGFMVSFKELKVGDEFTKPGSDLVWTKNTPFIAYGNIKDQNASACFRHPLITRWHYDHIEDEDLVMTVEKV